MVGTASHIKEFPVQAFFLNIGLNSLIFRWQDTWSNDTFICIIRKRSYDVTNPEWVKQVKEHHRHRFISAIKYNGLYILPFCCFQGPHSVAMWTAMVVALWPPMVPASALRPAVWTRSSPSSVEVVRILFPVCTRMLLEGRHEQSKLRVTRWIIKKGSHN